MKPSAAYHSEQKNALSPVSHMADRGQGVSKSVRRAGGALETAA
jgi:hypothetical protein